MKDEGIRVPIAARTAESTQGEYCCERLHMQCHVMLVRQHSFKCDTARIMRAFELNPVLRPVSIHANTSWLFVWNIQTNTCLNTLRGVKYIEAPVHTNKHSSAPTHVPKHTQIETFMHAYEYCIYNTDHSST